MGSAFVKQLTRAGHQVSVTARDDAKAAQVAAANPFWMPGRAGRTYGSAT